MESLHVLIIGLNGIVHYEEFSDATGKDVYDFDVKLTEEMKPESRGIVFYVRPTDGVIVYDEFVISLGFGIENLVSLSAISSIFLKVLRPRSILPCFDYSVLPIHLLLIRIKLLLSNRNISQNMVH